jgi:hypothetical protein
MHHGLGIRVQIQDAPRHARHVVAGDGGDLGRVDVARVGAQSVQGVE